MLESLNCLVNRATQHPHHRLNQTQSEQRHHKPASQCNILLLTTTYNTTFARSILNGPYLRTLDLSNLYSFVLGQFSFYLFYLFHPLLHSGLPLLHSGLRFLQHLLLHRLLGDLIHHEFKPPSFQPEQSQAHPSLSLQSRFEGRRLRSLLPRWQRMLF